MIHSCEKARYTTGRPFVQPRQRLVTPVAAKVLNPDSYQAVQIPIAQVTLEKYRYIRVGISVYDIYTLFEYEVLADSAAPSTLPDR
jgi:hypothetical protein